MTIDNERPKLLGCEQSIVSTGCAIQLPSLSYSQKDLIKQCVHNCSCRSQNIAGLTNPKRHSLSPRSLSLLPLKLLCVGRKGNLTSFCIHSPHSPPTRFCMFSMTFDEMIIATGYRVCSFHFVQILIQRLSCAGNLPRLRRSFKT